MSGFHRRNKWGEHLEYIPPISQTVDSESRVPLRIRKGHPRVQCRRRYRIESSPVSMVISYAMHQELERLSVKGFLDGGLAVLAVNLLSARYRGKHNWLTQESERHFEIEQIRWRIDDHLILSGTRHSERDIFADGSSMSRAIEQRSYVACGAQ